MPIVVCYSGSNQGSGFSNGYQESAVSGDHGGDPSGDDDDDGDYQDENYNELLEALVKKWLGVQLTHEVSASATEAFWKTTMDVIPTLIDHRNRFNIQKPVPGYKHLRRQLYKDFCPDISMKYVFMKKSDDSIEVVECTKAPTRSKSEYIKLYEEAHIKVMSFY